MKYKASITGIARHILRHQLIDEETLLIAIASAKRDNQTLLAYLVQHKLINATHIAHILSEDYGLPFVDLNTILPTELPIIAVNAHLIRQCHILPIKKTQNTLFIAVSDPTIQTSIDQIKFHTGLSVQWLIAEENKLAILIDNYLNSHEKNMTITLLQKLEELEANVPTTQNDHFSLTQGDDDAPIISFVHKILANAIQQGASDIHFEPYEQNYRIRYRIDGMLYDVSQPQINLANRISARLKIMAKLDIAERRTPQDGRFKLTLCKDHYFDFRVSTCPTLHGEKIVARILDAKHTLCDIHALGLEPCQQLIFSKYLHYPHGMILVTGPTGSGKTLTLYTAINILNKSSINISTIEDPIEIQLAGINQVNINTKANLTFATALRSFLRQDPDIIMVGEMRDLETSEIAVKAAQTGHLVLSTLHTNDAATTLPRLLNIGIASYNIAASVSLIIAQRLIRKLCDRCKQAIAPPSDMPQFTEAIYTAVGCSECLAGYKGRTGIFEFLPIDDEIRQLILQEADSQQIAKQAILRGMINLQQAGLLKVQQGITSLAEVNRMTYDWQPFSAQ